MSEEHVLPDEALDADIAILAKKGAGKTYTAKGIVERLLDDGARVLILDPLSTWWGLKSSADGERPGYPIAVFGGPHGDMALSESMARPLADLIAKNNFPAIMDIAFMKKAEQQRFTRDLLEELFAKNRDPLTIVLEEAHVFAPQSVSGAEASAFHEVDRIARMGRAFGFRLITITQRASRLHKDVLTQASTMIALRVQHQLDQKPIIEWFKANADADFTKFVEGGLANLKAGQAFVGATDQDFFDRVQFPRITTLDSSATPKRGEKRIEPKTLAEIDLSEVRKALDEPEPAEKEQSASTEVKIVRDETAIAEARQAGYEQGYQKGYRSGSTDGMKRAIEALKELQAVPHEDRATQIEKPKPPSASVRNVQSSGNLTEPQLKVLGALRYWARLGFAEPSKPQVAAVAGYSPTSGGFSNLLSSLRTAGYVEYPAPGHLALTDSGKLSAPAPPSGSVGDLLSNILSSPQLKIMDALSHGGSMRRADLADATDYSASSGGYSNLLSSLKTLKLISYPAKGVVKIEPWTLEGEGAQTND